MKTIEKIDKDRFHYYNGKYHSENQAAVHYDYSNLRSVHQTIDQYCINGFDVYCYCVKKI